MWGRDLGCRTAGSGDGMLFARLSRWWGSGAARCRNRMLTRSAMVAVAVEKTGGLFFHPIGSTSGNATRGSSPGAVGNATPNFGISSTLRAMR
jgi:hypothetical protein